MKELIYGRTLLAAARRTPTAIAVRDIDGYTATYSEHVERVARLANYLRANKWRRFAVLAVNGHHFLECWHAALLGAGLIVPLNYRLSAHELAELIDDASVDAVLVDPAYTELLDASLDMTSVKPEVVVLGNSVGFEQRLAEIEALLPPEPEEDDIVALMYTGGTTGRPKGALISHRAEVLNMYHQNEVLEPDENTVFLHQSPMFHGGAIYGILNPLARGGQVCFVPKFDAVDVANAIAEYGVTATQMGPTMIAMLLDGVGSRIDLLSTLEQLVFGTAPTPLALLERLRRELPRVKVFNGYGMTEAASALSYLRHEEHFLDGGRLLTSVGRPLTGVDITIRDDEGREVPVGVIGEICARAGNFMTGYWNREAETADAFRGGWYHTGDLGRVDSDGYLFVVDRLKEMIVSGGENVYSAEVENAVARHPGVAQCAVIGIPHDRWGQSVHAVVVLRPETLVDEQELDAFVRAFIAGFKVPKSWDIRTEPLPMSGAMKVLKRELHDAAIADTSAVQASTLIPTHPSTGR